MPRVSPSVRGDGLPKDKAVRQECIFPSWSRRGRLCRGRWEDRTCHWGILRQSSLGKENKTGSWAPGNWFCDHSPRPVKHPECLHRCQSHSCWLRELSGGPTPGSGFADHRTTKRGERNQILSNQKGKPHINMTSDVTDVTGIHSTTVTVIHAWKMESALSKPWGPTPSLQETQGTEEQVQQHRKEAICQSQNVGHSTDEWSSFSNILRAWGKKATGRRDWWGVLLKNKRDFYFELFILFQYETNSIWKSCLYPDSKKKF